MKTLKQKKHESLTVEKLKTYPGLENLSQHEAEEIVQSIEKFTILMFQMFKRSKVDENR